MLIRSSCFLVCSFISVLIGILIVCNQSFAFGGKRSANLSHTQRASNQMGRYPYKSDLTFQIPVCNCTYCSKSLGYGRRRRPKRGASSNHLAVDIAAPEGTPVLAMESGLVSVRSDSEHYGYGRQLRVVHNSSFESRYAHLSVFVKRSGWVNKDELIGYSGNTGVSTGPHIHLEILRNGVKVNPENYIGLERQILTKKPCSSSAKTRSNRLQDWRRGSGGIE